MRISIATKTDLPEILHLQKSCYIEEAELYSDLEIPPLTQTQESIEQDFEKEIFLKMSANDQIIGSVRGHLDSGTCKIGRLIVDKRFRNQGLGKKLMAAIESQFDQAGRYELFTGDKSSRNLALYSKLGYTEFKRQRLDNNLTLVFLEKVNR